MNRKINFMQILAFSIALLINLVSCCEDSHQFSNSRYNCIFYMIYNDSSCTNFTFKSCYWVEPPPPDYSGQRRMLQSSTDDSWDSCTHKCCDSNVNYPQEYMSINACQSYLDEIFRENQRITSLILGLTIGGIIGLPLLIFIICFLILICRNCLRDNPNEKARHSAMQLNANNSNKDWKRQEFIPNFESNCAICLQERPNLLTNCKHLFHKKCLRQWLNKQVSCPLCINRNFEILDSYCVNCLIHFYSIKLEDLNKQQENSFQICRDCVDRNNLQ